MNARQALTALVLATVLAGCTASSGSIGEDSDSDHSSVEEEAATALLGNNDDSTSVTAGEDPSESSSQAAPTTLLDDESKADDTMQDSSSEGTVTTINPETGSDTDVEGRYESEDDQVKNLDSAYCLKSEELATFSSAFLVFGPSEEFQALIGEVIADLEELETIAPSDVGKDIDTFRGVIEQIADHAGEYETIEELLAGTDAANANDPEAEEAFEAIAGYNRRQCDVYWG